LDTRFHEYNVRIYTSKTRKRNTIGEKEFIRAKFYYIIKYYKSD